VSRGTHYRASVGSLADDADRVAAVIMARIDALTFLDRTADEVTALLIDTAAEWAAGQGWRVYRRARSVVPLPPPYRHRHSTLDVACARPAGPPVVIEVDRTDRRRTLDKLLAEAAAGRVALWVRWGTGGFAAPPAPVRLVPCVVSARTGTGGRRYVRLPATERPPPPHSAAGGEPAAHDPLA
jgi:hypothetical protein